MQIVSRDITLGLLLMLAWHASPVTAKSPRGICCPDCGSAVCQPRLEQKREKKSTFDVECKEVCVPKFRWPWQMCRPPQCGYVKMVRVLRKVDYECTKCGYSWHVAYVGRGGRSGGDCTTVAGEKPGHSVSSARPPSHQTSATHNESTGDPIAGRID